MTAHTFDTVRQSPFYTPEHEAFRQSFAGSFRARSTLLQRVG